MYPARLREGSGRAATNNCPTTTSGLQLPCTRPRDYTRTAETRFCTFTFYFKSIILKNTFLLLLKYNLRRVLLLLIKYLKSCLLLLLLKYFYPILLTTLPRYLFYSLSK